MQHGLFITATNLNSVILSGAPAFLLRPAFFAGRAGAQSKDLRFSSDGQAARGEPQVPRLGRAFERGPRSG